MVTQGLPEPVLTGGHGASEPHLPQSAQGLAQLSTAVSGLLSAPQMQLHWAPPDWGQRRSKV